MGIAPSVTYPSPFEWPQDQIKTITAISRDRQAKVTSPLHGFTQEDVNVTSMTFKQVLGMIQINSLTTMVASVIDTNDFTVAIDSSSFSNYSSGGVAIVDSGIPPETQAGAQIFNTPFQNTFS